MLEYIARAKFQIPTPQGQKIVSKGEVLRLSSLKATAGVQRGVLLEKSVSGLQDILHTVAATTAVLVDKLQYSYDQASKKALRLAMSLLIRHEALKTFRPPTPEFQDEVTEFNRTATGKNPITKINSDKGAGEWAGYNCNIGEGCSHGCLYCYASEIAVTRFKRVASKEAWRDEKLIDVKTGKCKKYPEPIMFATSHDITGTYLQAYRCHLYNILKAGNTVILVSKPHRESIEAICSEFSSFRDTMILRFTIGGLDDDALKVWEPGAPSLSERMWCLQYAFEQGFKTSVSAEPMLVNAEGAEQLYYAVEPFITEDIWFGKMFKIGSYVKHRNPEVAQQATELQEFYKDDNIMQFVRRMTGLPKVAWKDSIKEVIQKNTKRNEVTE